VLLDCAYRADVIVSNAVIIELQCVEQILPLHAARLLNLPPPAVLHRAMPHQAAA
jgi:hypothetical protein